MDTYKIIHPATNRVVNLYISNSTGSVPHGTKLSLYPWENNSDQKFLMEWRGSNVIFRSQRDTSQVINRDSSTNNAILWPFSNDTATLNDSLIDTETEGKNMRIKLVRKNLYLTKQSNSYMLYWATKENTNRQYFKLEKISSSTSNSKTMLPCKYTGYGTLYGEKAYNSSNTHYAIDLVNSKDTPIYAWCDGVISRIFRYDGTNINLQGNDSLGNCVFLHSNNPDKNVATGAYVRAIYAHLNTINGTIKENASVKKGDLIGTMGMSGAATGTHLHFALQCADHYVLSNETSGNRYENSNWVNPNKYLPEIDNLNP